MEKTNYYEQSIAAYKLEKWEDVIHLTRQFMSSSENMKKTEEEIINILLIQTRAMIMLGYELNQDGRNEVLKNYLIILGIDFKHNKAWWGIYTHHIRTGQIDRARETIQTLRDENLEEVIAMIWRECQTLRKKDPTDGRIKNYVLSLN